MFERRKFKYYILFVIVVMGTLHLRLGYFCNEKDCALATSTKEPYLSNIHNRVVAKITDHSYHGNEYRTSLPCKSSFNILPGSDFLTGNLLYQNLTTGDLDPSYTFDLEGEQDVMVFLHMQKTGGTTFGRHLIRDLATSRPCQCRQQRKKCDCKNSRDLVWLVSRYSTGWRCGLHADWTELTTCVDKMLDKLEGNRRRRRYLYITILRDPYTRYLSEYKHVQRGATWRAARLQCNGRQASLQQVPFCFEGDDWRGVSLDEFTRCPYNLANNRETRMLANLSSVGCYEHITDPVRLCEMLASAKENLHKLAFFGLTEYQLETQYLFERTFGLKFKSDFFQYNHTHSDQVDISERHRHRVLQLNALDEDLYTYAKTLFFHRLQSVIDKDPSFTSDIRAKFKNKSSAEGDNREYMYHVTDDYDENEADDDDDDDDDSEYNRRTVHRNVMSVGRTNGKMDTLKSKRTIHDHAKYAHNQRSRNRM